MSVRAGRAALVRTGVRIEIFTVLWMVVEAAVSLGAGGPRTERPARGLWD